MARQATPTTNVKLRGKPGEEQKVLVTDALMIQYDVGYALVFELMTIVNASLVVL